VGVDMSSERDLDPSKSSCDGPCLNGRESGGDGRRGLLGGAGLDCSGESFESVRGLGLYCLGSCSRQWPESDDLGIGGSAFVRSAAFLSDRSRRRGDVAVPSLTVSTMLTRTSCFCTATGAASAKSITENIRRIRASILYRRIFVRYAASIRRGNSECSMKSKRKDAVQKKRKVGCKFEKVIDYSSRK
jgi:hypothetical protein